MADLSLGNERALALGSSLNAVICRKASRRGTLNASIDNGSANAIN
jgi:hypothetical protein